MIFNPLKKLRGKKYTAIDFGHDSLKVVHCRSSGKNIQLLKWGKRKLPDEAIENGQIQNINLVVNELKGLMNNHSIRPGKLLFSPAVGQEFVRKQEIPVMPEDEMQEALQWEVEEYLNLSPGEVASDYLILQEKEQNYDLLLVVLPDKVLEGYQQVFQRMNYTPRTANVQELALISLLAAQEKMNEPTMLVNLGKNLTRIVIAREDNFYLSRSVEIGGRHFTRIFKTADNTWAEAEKSKVQSVIEISEQEAEEEPVDIDLMVSGIDNKNSGEAELLSMAEELTSEMERSLEYYNNRFSGREISDIHITGGGFKLTGLKEYIDKEIDQNIKVIDPLKNIADNRKDKSAEFKEFMAVAVGLVTSEVFYHES